MAYQRLRDVRHHLQLWNSLTQKLYLVQADGSEDVSLFVNNC